MIDTERVSWGEIAVDTQDLVVFKNLKKAIGSTVKTGVSRSVRSKDPRVKIRVTPMGVKFHPKVDDSGFIRKLTLIQGKVDEALGISYPKPEDGKKQGTRACPKCNGVFRVVPIVTRKGRPRFELVCRNPECGYCVMELHGKDGVRFADWGTGQPVEI